VKVEKKRGRCLAVFGTASDVGKSVVVTALCRIFADLGLRVAPFKAQNMSNNSFVTLEGGEVGRAQAAQAEAARAALHVDMNPVLLKPCSDTGAQVVLHGKPMGNRQAGEYFGDTEHLCGQALASLERLRTRYDLVVIEGAGSCAEVNLRSRDFANLRMAHASDAPALLVSDIDRGGVFAQIIGTLELLSSEDRDRIRGLVINRFRGDAALFRDGIDYIEHRTGLPVLGLIPFFHHIDIDIEDGQSLEPVLDPLGSPDPGKINIAVVRLPHISNSTDFAPFERDPAVRLHYLVRPRPLEAYRHVFLPGSKNVRADTEWLRKTGWAKRISEYVIGGGRLGGICGGYQILGRSIRDPYGIEGPPGATEGLGLLDVVTELREEKELCRCSGLWEDSGSPVEGYEIHMGTTTRGVGVPAVIRVAVRSGDAVQDGDGARTVDGRVWGVYIHGLFDTPGSRHAFLKTLQPDYEADPLQATESRLAYRDRQYDLLAQHFRAHLDMTRLLKIVDLEVGNSPRGWKERGR
jgi:adenosylcobyric acid synthase